MAKAMATIRATDDAVTLSCGIYGEASVFPVQIARGATVFELQEKLASFLCEEPPKVGFRVMTLYLARKKKHGPWLRDDEVEENLLRGDVDADYEKLRSSRTLDEEAYFGKHFMPRRAEIHVLVELHEVPKKKQRLAWQSTPWKAHKYEPTSPHFLLEKEDVDESGLSHDPIMLYCRPRFHQQFEFLRDHVLEKVGVGWIVGPSGAGKSTTAMAFASFLERDKWIVTWIHVNKMDVWRCVRLIGDERRSRFLDLSDVDDVLADEDTKHQVVLVDGWTADDDFKTI